MAALIKASKFVPLPFPAVPGTTEPILTLAAALGPSGATTEAAIQAAGQIVFHCAGDTGATAGPTTENEVVDKLLADFTGEAPAAVPQFFYNLGDIVYSFGEHKYYFDQFYDAYRDYPRPIFAIPGNHDGIVLPPPAGTGVASDSLAAFLSNFCAPGFAHSSDAVGISRTTMIQPGVYFTLQAPLVRILGLYSNMLENPGVISTTPDPTTGKPTFPAAQRRAARLPDRRAHPHQDREIRRRGPHRRPSSALLLRHALRPRSPCSRRSTPAAVPLASGRTPSSLATRTTISATPRAIGNRQIPFLVIGNGGHGLTALNSGQTIRTPQPMPVFAQPEANDTVTFESYDDKNYGYTRILVDATQLRIEYHPASDGATTKTPDDAVTVDLATGTLTTYTPPS